MSHEDETQWEERYQSGDTPWDKGAPSPGLVDFLAAHPGGATRSVLVPGCGTGHDVRAWAQAGYQARGLDISPSALRLARERTLATGLNATFQQGDFLSEPALPIFDWVFEHTLFCAIQPERRPDYVQAVLRWLKPRGQFLAVFYMIPDQEGPPFGVSREQILEYFGPCLERAEDWTPRSYPNRTGLEWMVWWRKPAEPRMQGGSGQS